MGLNHGRRLIAGVVLTVATAACSQEASRPAGDGTAGAAKDAGARVGAAVETVDVKAALSLDKAVDASNVNVDTDHVTKVVKLKGSVPTADQKARAETIAKQEAEGYRVDNELVVRVP